jgi:hypothetical protein
MTSTEERLTRDNRYEGRWTIERLPGFGIMGALGGQEVTRCRSCGSMVAAGSEDLHERLHPRISCTTAYGDMGCGKMDDGKHRRQGHAWEEQFRS